MSGGGHNEGPERGAEPRTGVYPRQKPRTGVRLDPEQGSLEPLSPARVRMDPEQGGWNPEQGCTRAKPRQLDPEQGGGEGCGRNPEQVWASLEPRTGPNRGETGPRTGV